MDDMLRKKDANYDKKSDIKWNFTKFLVSRDGRVLKRYEPTDKLSDIEADMQMEVNPVLSNIMARRSIRKYLDKPVEHEKLETIALAGTPIHVNFEDTLEEVTTAEPHAVLLHNVDVTAGTMNGTALYFGVVNINSLEESVQAKVTAGVNTIGAVSFIKA
jgi:hypothetical protein